MAYKINDFTSPELSQVIALRMRLDWEGYGIYCAIISLLERQPDAALDCDYLVIGFHLSAEETMVKAIVEDFNLFEFEMVDGRRRFFLTPLREEVERKASMSVRRAQAAKKRWEKKERKTEKSSRLSDDRKASENSPVTPDFSFDILKNPEAISENSEWLRKVAADHKCSMEILLKLFRLFLKHVSDSKREPYNTLRDAQTHFYRWLSKPYARDQKQAMLRDEERERRRRERDEHDANAITFDEYIRRKELELQTERCGATKVRSIAI